MIAVRKSMPFLAKGKLTWLLDTPNQSLSYWRNTPEGRLLALHNLSEEPFTITVTERLRDALDPTRLVLDTITVPAYGYRWLVET
jgi:hypothetical protein